MERADSGLRNSDVKEEFDVELLELAQSLMSTLEAIGRQGAKGRRCSPDGVAWYSPISQLTSTVATKLSTSDCEMQYSYI